ncbi:MAG: HAD family hydrolase [Thermoprotei archaeon]|nr:MAG: HAD family hydrolase [Thermoprotei archaeon]
MCKAERIRIISFDLTGTLVTEEFVDYFWLELIPQLFAKRHSVNLDEAKRIVYSSYDEIGSQDIRWYTPQYWFERFDLGLDVSSALQMVKNKVVFYPDVEDALRLLSGRYEVVISSNLSREFIDVILEGLKFRGFKAIFSCVSDLGLTTKTAEFYRFVSSKLGIPASDILHVGDDPEKDFENPLKAGMRAILVIRDENRMRGLTYPCIKSLNELQRLLD